jgi:hypothetical protein
MSPYKAELKKLIGLQFTNTYKKLTCPKYLCEEHKTQQKETAQDYPFCGKRGSIRPTVRTRISEVKRRMSSLSKLGFSSGSEEDDDGWGKEGKDEIYVECLYCARFFIGRPRQYRTGSMPKMSKVCPKRLCGLYQKGLCA